MTVIDSISDPRLAATMLRYAALLAGNRDDAEDLVQEAAAKLLAERAGGREITHVNTYLRRIVTSVFLNGHRRARLWRRTLPRLTPVDGTPAVDDLVAERSRLGKALQQLPPRQRAAVVLRYYEDQAYADIAAALHCPETTARSLVNRGLRALRLTIEGED